MKYSLGDLVTVSKLGGAYWQISELSIVSAVGFFGSSLYDFMEEIFKIFGIAIFRISTIEIFY